jgi:two-component system, sensor histidine kinase and response regulator
LNPTAEDGLRNREKISGRHIPIIALTAHTAEEDRQTCLGAGMDDYLSKPFDLIHLGKMIEKNLS